MRNLRKIILGLLVIGATVSGFANEKEQQVENSYNYWSIGAGIPTILSLKFGHRQQAGHHGFEYGVGITPLIYLTEGHVFGSYLYYPKPSLQSQFYYGLGLRAGGFMELNRAKFAYIAPGLIFGKEYLSSANSRRFIQVAWGMGGLTTSGPMRLSSISLAWGYTF